MYETHSELLSFDHWNHKRRYKNDKLVTTNINNFRKIWHKVIKPINNDFIQDHVRCPTDTDDSDEYMEDWVRDSHSKEFKSVKVLKPLLKHSENVSEHISILPDDTLLLEDEKESIVTKLDSLFDFEQIDSIGQDFIGNNILSI